MTKREFFENELKMMPSEIGSAVPMNVDGEKEVTEAWLMAFVKHLVEDLKEAKNWHTGTPTEKGWYLCAYDTDIYLANYWVGSGWLKQYRAEGIDCRQGLLAWQKIESFEAGN